MPQLEKSNIITLDIKIKPELQTLFIDWQSKLNAQVSTFPGFLSLEIISPPHHEKKTKWIINLRFFDEKAASNWMSSEEKKKLFQDLNSLLEGRELKETRSCESSIMTGATEVFVTKVTPEMEKSYRNWISEIHKAEAKFPGFRGIYTQSSQNKGENWITFLQFDTPENLDHWLNSPERQEILTELKPFISSLENHRVISPYAGWFSSIAKMGEVPSIWKQTMLVLLVLFPIIMLEFKFLSPLTSGNGLNISLATFIGNAISVTLISWPGMPIALFFLGWWLLPNTNVKTTLIGTMILIILYLIEIAIFWSFV